ncbi:MAG: hypothetical protein WED10_12690 [Brumimicrobium sp.]
MSETENLDANAGKSDLNMSSQARETLASASGWAKAMGIIGIVFSALGIIAGIVLLFASPLIGIIYLIIYAIFIYVWSLLVGQANSISSGVLDMDKFAVNYKKFWQISVIILIVMFVLGIIAALVGQSMFSSIGSGMNF